MNASGSKGRGCLFFNFGTACALRLLVALHSLRRHYAGPVTVLLGDEDADARRLAKDIAKLGVDVKFVTGLSMSEARHEVFKASPYATTLVFDSDLVFRAPIDELWEPLEREGLLVTQYRFPGLDANKVPTLEKPPDRIAAMGEITWVIGERDAEASVKKILVEGIDINIGVMGLSRPLGDAFLEDYAAYMEKGRGNGFFVLDELLALALITRHRHALMNESWNCPADEQFRTISLLDAKIVHYFADGLRFGKVRAGRNPSSWSGRMWYATYEEASKDLDLRYWQKHDPSIASATDRYFANGVGYALSESLKAPYWRIRKFLRPVRAALRRYPSVHDLLFGKKDH